MRSPFKTVGLFGLGAAALVAAFFVGRARAAGIPDANVLTYTGYLEGADGQPLTGDHSIFVRFWESAEATSDLCTGELASVTLQAGRFQVPLPVECLDVVRGNRNLFVDVSVDGSSLGRTQLGAVPFAVEAERATSADQAATLSGPLSLDLFSAEQDLDDEGLLDNNAGTDLLTRAQQDARYVLAADQPLITAWTSFNPTVVASNGNPVTGVSSNKGRWRRVGDSIDVQITTRFNTDVNSGDFLTWPLPMGLTPLAPPDGLALGTGTLYNGTTVTVCAADISVTDSRIYLDCQGGPTLNRSMVGPVPKNYYVSLQFTVPVEGWTLTGP